MSKFFSHSVDASNFFVHIEPLHSQKKLIIELFHVSTVPCVVRDFIRLCKWIPIEIELYLVRVHSLCYMVFSCAVSKYKVIFLVLFQSARLSFLFNVLFMCSPGLQKP